MEYDGIESLRLKHPAWRLLRATNAALVLSFLGGFFVDANRGACAASEVVAALDDYLYILNTAIEPVGTNDQVNETDWEGPASTDHLTDHPNLRGQRHQRHGTEQRDQPDRQADDVNKPPRFRRSPRDYLEDWASDENGYLRRFYPPGSDEVYYEIVPAFADAYAWVESLQGRSFVGTESRLHTVVDLLRQIVYGTENDPQLRLTELHHRRDEIDKEIAAVETGEAAMLDATGVRDRYQQVSATARELLVDFREVEANFRQLDRGAREKIATWDGTKGKLLTELVGARSAITESDQGRSFQAFYEYLLSQSRQDELTELLAKVAELDAVDDDRRLRTIHHQWSEAADRTQETVRQISDQLRRFLDDQVWFENRRVIDLIKSVESAAVEVRDDPPSLGLSIDVPGIDIALPFERPLYQQPTVAAIDSSISSATTEVDTQILFAQRFVDQARLSAHIRSVLPPGSAALLSDIVTLYPIEQGASEIVGYLALTDDDISIEMDETDETVIDYPDTMDPALTRRIRLPKVTVRRR